MENTPFFSVVIALYNKEDYIENTLKSVLNQSYSKFEIIIINDGSTDNSESIVKSINDPKIRLFNIENHGAAFARNYGIKKAVANYVALLDADDLWHINHLETLFHLVNEFPNAGMYCTGYNIKLGSKHFKDTKLKGIPDDYRGIIKNYFESNLFNSIVNSSVVVIPKHVLDETELFDVNMKSGQDTYLWTQIAIKHSVAIHNITTTTVLRNDNSLSNSVHTKDRILFLDKFIEQEKTNEHLKKFMDMNRYSVALNFKMNNEASTSKSIFSNIDTNNISLKQKLIYGLPVSLLRMAFYLKKSLDKKGLFFHLYR
jgi:glycosyltransferase involved in cell wall biosynthesis